METSRFPQIGWKRLGRSATWLHIMIVSGTRPVPVSFRNYLSIGAVCTPMNGGATIGTLSERTLPAPPSSSPWKITCCNKSIAPHGRTNSSASWTAIRKFLRRKWDSLRIGDHSHCGHDDRRTPSVVPCSPLIMICKRPPEGGDRAVAEKLNDRPTASRFPEIWLSPCRTGTGRSGGVSPGP